MNARNPTLLALALASACLSTTVVAQSTSTSADAGIQSDRTTDELDRAADAAMPPPVSDTEPPVADTLIDGTPIDPEVEAMTRTEPPPVDAAQATGLAGDDAAQRSSWVDLDADGDGRISLGEASVDGDFNSGFETMDADDDGFVSRAEFDAHGDAHGGSDDGDDDDDDDDEMEENDE